MSLFKRIQSSKEPKQRTSLEIKTEEFNALNKKRLDLEKIIETDQVNLFPVHEKEWRKMYEQLNEMHNEIKGLNV